jgi:hypothetical protein
MKEYDEKQSLINYVIFYYTNLLDNYDKKILKFRWVIRKETNVVDSKLMKKYGITKEEETDLQRFMNDDIFFQYFGAKVEKLLTENRDKIHINRCPNCNKITRTNIAKQCRYCGCDWH